MAKRPISKWSKDHSGKNKKQLLPTGLPANLFPRKALRESVCIMSTGLADLGVSIKAFNDGLVFRFLGTSCKMQVFEKMIQARMKQSETKTQSPEPKVAVENAPAGHSVFISQQILNSLNRPAPTTTDISS